MHRVNFKYRPHQTEPCMHSGHDKFSGSLSCNDQVLEQYNMQLSPALPMAMAVFPLQGIFTGTKEILRWKVKLQAHIKTFQVA